EIHGVKYGALSDAMIFAAGHDPEGKHRDAALTAISVYADDLGSVSMQITDKLVEGGEPDVTQQYVTEFLDSGIPIQRIRRESLVALVKAGNEQALAVLREAAELTRDSMYVVALEEAGYPEEAVALGKKIYAQDPSRNNGLAVLNIEFSLPIWKDLW